jgi:hypothetical protein
MLLQWGEDMKKEHTGLWITETQCSLQMLENCLKYTTDAIFLFKQPEFQVSCLNMQHTKAETALNSEV